jgi:hypothetical protein
MRTLLAVCIALAAWTWALAEEPPSVIINDQPPQVGIAGPGAPKHIIGLERYSREIVMDTGVKQYGLSYNIARDKDRPGVAIPGEGYIGMPHPSGANWYAGGFFDLQINGQTIGTVPIHSQTARSTGRRGIVDFVFDTPMAVVRIRFVTLAGGDALYCQTLLEPKVEMKELRLNVRCYPSGFINNGDRHVLTPTRDLAQGQAATLDLATEYWLLYYDKIFDEGYASPTARGEGPCAVLFPGSQADKIGFTVGGYGIDTAMTLKPPLRDFRFVFFDFKGTKNEAAMATLRERGPALLQELATFAFTDPSIAAFPLAQKQEEVKRALALVPEEKQMAADYAKWAVELDAQLKLIRSGAAGAIMAEANVAKIIQEWERGLPELKLKALLNEI